MARSPSVFVLFNTHSTVLFLHLRRPAKNHVFNIIIFLSTTLLGSSKAAPVNGSLTWTERMRLGWGIDLSQFPLGQ